MILDIIYYQLYRFYSWQPDEFPHFTTIWSIGIAWAVLAFFPLNWLWILLFSGSAWSAGSYIVFWAVGILGAYIELRFPSVDSVGVGKSADSQWV